MKKIYALLSFSLFTLVATAQTIISDSATMGQGYANDVHYSLQNGTVSTVSNTNWHLAFRSGLQTDGIFINSTANVKAYLTNKAIADWASLDSTHITNEVFNTDTSWEIGAFNRTFDSPYSSWGVYNTITKKVTGDSLYLLKVGNNWIKLWVVEKDYGTWKVRVGTTSIDTTFTILHSDIRFFTFGYLNLNTLNVLNREPADSAWDFKFTRYYSLQPSQNIYYPSTGVLNNRGVTSVKVSGIDKNTYMNYGVHPMVNNISTIGADWKSFDNATFQWNITDSTCYFVKAKTGDIWKLWFTGFGGASSGKSYFNKQKLFTVGIGERNLPIAQLAVYPNPSSENVTLVLDNINMRSAVIRIVDLQGKIVFEENRTIEIGMQTLPINVSELNNGIYIMSLEGENYTANSRVVISK
jgi:hypothetical protein